MAFDFFRRAQPVPRRTFLRTAGATAATSALALAACKKDDPEPTGPLDVGSGDAGVLNYAYALEQLEAAFYTQVVQGAYFKGLTAGSAEKQLFTDLALHERVHADFFKTLLGTAAIRVLETDFSTIDFADRTSVLNAAKTFEDLGVAAYNGAARFFTDVKFLLMAGKIVSVEARHAALIRDLIVPGTFVGADVVDLFAPTAGQPVGTGTGTGTEKLQRPAAVLAQVNAYLREGSKLAAASLA